VLNARRHRGGDQAVMAKFRLLPVVCSTPEGIEAAIRTRYHGRRSR